MNKPLTLGSVWKALQTLKSLESVQEQKTDYVLIHDGARPFLNQEMLERLCACVKEEKACVLGMPVKDTIISQTSQLVRLHSSWMITLLSGSENPPPVDMSSPLP